MRPPWSATRATAVVCNPCEKSGRLARAKKTNCTPCDRGLGNNTRSTAGGNDTACLCSLPSPPVLRFFPLSTPAELHPSEQHLLPRRRKIVVVQRNDEEVDERDPGPLRHEYVLQSGVTFPKKAPRLRQPNCVHLQYLLAYEEGSYSSSYSS